MIGRLLRVRYAEGGAISPHATGSQLIVMSPGWIQLPDGTVQRYPEDVLRAMNQARAKGERP